MVTSALNVPGMGRCRVTKKGRKPGRPTELDGPGGTSESEASTDVPRIERPAVTRESTRFELKATTTSGVVSVMLPERAPPASTVRAKYVCVDAPAGTSMFCTGLKSGSLENEKVPGGPLVAMSWNHARTAGRMPALGTR